jgi:hypothetical protein
MSDFPLQKITLVLREDCRVVLANRGKREMTDACLSQGESRPKTGKFPETVISVPGKSQDTRKKPEIIKDRYVIIGGFGDMEIR